VLKKTAKIGPAPGEQRQAKEDGHPEQEGEGGTKSTCHREPLELILPNISQRRATM
jgi:hypothetical protein